MNTTDDRPLVVNDNDNAPNKATMVQAMLERPGHWVLRESPVPEPERAQIRVRLEGCGVCASGIPVWEGRDWFEYPRKPGELGHEGWGIVDAVGPEVREGPQVGDRVAFLADGAYSSHICLSPDQLIHLPKILAGRPFPAEPVGCAINVFERGDIQSDDTVAIVGMGFLGCLLLQLAQSTGARVTCFSARPWSLTMAGELGAEERLQMVEPWKADALLAEHGLGNFSRVIEATGVQEGLDFASALVAEGGRLVIAGYHQDGLRQVNMQQWNWKGIDVINAHERDPARYASGMRKGIERVASGELDTDLLMTHRYPLAAINDAYRDLVKRPEGFMKGWIDFSEPLV